MASPCVNGTLPARPDIEGIGTRVATYAQVFLTIFTIALTPAARSFDAWWAVLVTSLGLQFSAIAQRRGLTLFHALIVTLLAWPVFAMSWVYIFLHWREDSMPPEILIATHIHGFLFVGFGLWIWSTAPTFGECPELNGDMQFIVLGKSINPLGWIRIFVLVLYSIWGIMFILAAGAAILGTIPSIRQRASQRLGRPHSAHAPQFAVYLPTRTRTLVLVTLFNVSALGIAIWSVESLLLRNVTGTSHATDNAVTFGQTSALILLVGPVFTFVRLLRYRILGTTSTTGNDREGMPLTPPGRGAGAMVENPDEKDERQSSVARNLIRRTTSDTSA